MYDTPFDNIMMLSDSYKVGHRPQYPPGTTRIASYFESRGGRSPWTQFFGLQYLVKRYLCGKVVTPRKIKAARKLVVPHLGGDREVFGEDRWDYIAEKHGGRLPLEIRAVPEGLKVPTGNVLMTVENTDPECFWLTNFVETLLVKCWYPTTVATMCQHFRQMFRFHLEATGSSMDALPWMLHNFGDRGSTSVESSAWGDVAHLSTGFRGSDTLSGLTMAAEYYDDPNASNSIPAYEHSTVTSWGREREVDCYRHALAIHPKGPVSVVSDSYDFFNAVENIWGGVLRDEVLAREGRLVIRPDSFEDIPEGVRRSLDILGRKFPSTVNARGFRVLHEKVRIIQGDGIDDFDTVEKVLRRMERDDPVNGKWAAENCFYGSGGGIIQKVNRDTQKFAFKCWEADVDGATIPVYKQPLGMGMKDSKPGKHKLVLTNGEYKTVPWSEPGTDILRRVFSNGKFRHSQTLAEVRARADDPLLVNPGGSQPKGTQ